MLSRNKVGVSEGVAGKYNNRLVAQLVEHLSYTQEVIGSSPIQRISSDEHGAPRAHNPYRSGGSTPPAAIFYVSALIYCSFKNNKKLIKFYIVKLKSV